MTSNYHQHTDILILGGMGPVASNNAELVLLEEAAALGVQCDQDYPSYTVAQHAYMIPDRTDNLSSPECVANGAVDILTRYRDLCVVPTQHKVKKIVWAPCNSFHMPAIWKKLNERMNEYHLYTHYTIVNMVKAVYDDIKTRNINNIGLLSTTGTRKNRTYHEALKGINIIEVDISRQQEVHDLIYGKNGIKTKIPVEHRITETLVAMIAALASQGAEAVILGCAALPIAMPKQHTDLPLIIDPVRVSARTVLEQSGWRKKLS